MRSLLPLFAVAAVFAADTPVPAENKVAPPKQLRVFIRSGPKTHKPGDHDHPAFLRDWVPLLIDHGASATGSETFPTAEQLAQTDVVIIHRQGGGDFKPEERERITAFTKNGGGLVVIHAGSVASTPEGTDFYKELIGGSWRQKVTRYREGPMQLDFVDKTHVITARIADFKMQDEIYYEMDLRNDIHVLASSPTPKKVGDGFEVQTQAWTYERDAYRAFVFIPGHTYVNFQRNDVRTLLLRGIAWAGKHPRPADFSDMVVCPPPPPIK
ncbi:MAG: ThuA domain-containing protein [Opitutales bacterium]|nr:MAG: ThuA domain-containing protein [Opitutales bacterium]